MRHGKKFNHLSRKKGHRRALLANLGTQLIMHKRITTTVAKAKALRMYIEPLITRSKIDSTHNRRVVFRYLQDKQVINELFGEVSNRIADRPGGYTRILRTEHRAGDNAEMCIIELVDYNESYITDKKSKVSKKKRTRRGRSGSTKSTEGVAVAAAADEVVEEASELIEDVKEDVSEEIIDNKEEEE